MAGQQQRSSRGLHLISHQPAGRLHSQLETGVSSVALKRNGREQARLHSKDAAALGITGGPDHPHLECPGSLSGHGPGHRYRAFGCGSCYPPAPGSPRGEDEGLEAAGNPNVLTLDVGTSQFGQGCSAQTCLVRAEPHISDQRDAFDEYQEKLVALATA